MGVPKTGKRFGKPSAKFLEKQRQREITKGKILEGIKKIAPDEGDLLIFLDDERKCPEEMTLARTPSEFHQLMQNLKPNQLKELHLDWYLGSGQVTGTDIAKNLANMINDTPENFMSLEMIRYHSSDWKKAREMMAIVHPALDAIGMDDVMHDIAPRR